MALGPIEVLVVAFPQNQFRGEIIPELNALVTAGTISVVDGLFVTKDAGGDIAFVEFGELGGDHDAAAFAALMSPIASLLSDEDVAELAADLEPNSSAAILVFEHTWAKGFRDAIVRAGGVMTGDFRVPGLAVEQLLAELTELSAE